MQRWERERNGKFVLIFPFNQRSEELAVCINKQAIGDGSIGVKGLGSNNFMKELIQEIKMYYDERASFKAGKLRSKY